MFLTTIKRNLVKGINLIYLPYYIRNLLSKKIENNSIVIVSQDLAKNGSEVLCLSIAKEMISKGQKICLISYQLGPLVKEYQKLLPLLIVPKGKIKKKAQCLKNRYNCNKVICNTIVTGDSIKHFNRAGYSSVSLVHELYNVIVDNHFEMNCKDIYNYATTTIFSSTRGYEDFVKCLKEYGYYRNDKIFNYLIRPQGLYLTGDKSVYDKSMIFSKYNIPADAKIVINVARANRRKGIDLFLDVARHMNKVNKNIRFIWIGDKAKVYLEQEKKRYGKKAYENVNIINYISDHNLLSDFYRIADVLFLSSREDPFPSIVLEAFNAGTPVVAFDRCGGFVDIVRDNETGYLIEPFNTEAVAKTIISMINDKTKMDIMSNNCKKIINYFSFEEYCEFLLLKLK